MDDIDMWVKNIEAEFSTDRYVVRDSSFWWKVLKTHPELAREVAWNKKLPDDIMMHLAQHAEWRIRDDIARKRRMSMDICELLSRDTNAMVRMTVAENINTPVHILNRMKDDEDEEVRTIIQKRLKDGCGA